MWNLKISTREIPNSKAWPEKGELVKKNKFRNLAARNMDPTTCFNRNPWKGELKFWKIFCKYILKEHKNQKWVPIKATSNFKVIITFIQHLQHFKPHHKISSRKPFSTVCSGISIIRGSYEIHLALTGRKDKMYRNTSG